MLNNAFWPWLLERKPVNVVLSTKLAKRNQGCLWTVPRVTCRGISQNYPLVARTLLSGTLSTAMYDGRADIKWQLSSTW